MSELGPIVLLEPDHDRDHFDCGNAALNSYLKRFALQNQKKGVIRNYVALLDADALGLGLLAYVNVRLEKRALTSESRGERAVGTDRHQSHAALFSAAIAQWPEVVACHAMTGDMDYLLRVQVEDMAHFSRFMQDQLLHHPSVIDVKTSFSLKCIKETTALPLL